MSDRITPPSLDLPAELVLALFDAAAAAARAAARVGRSRAATRTRRGCTLRPGTATPVWNELAKHAAGLLRNRGDKARLARILGVPRQRLQDCLRARTACLDAERTLLLLCWIAYRRQGRDLLA
jgi:hypothetical protein